MPRELKVNEFTLKLENKDVFDQGLVYRVQRPFVRENPRHASLARYVNELHLRLFKSMATQCDNECILSLECLGKCFPGWCNRLS